MPLAPFALSLVLGIIAGSLITIQQPLLLVILTAVVVVALCCYRLPRVQTTLLYVCFLVLGAFIAPDPDTTAPASSFEGIIISELSEKPKTIAVDVLTPQDGKERRLYIWKDERSRQLQIGDAILVSQTRETFVGPRAWQKSDKDAIQLSAFQRLKIRALHWRHQLLNKYRQGASQQDDAYGILAAMTLGDKSALSKEQRDTFNETGASHVLALSGLHLSIIYMLLTRLMTGRRYRWLKQSILILSIWAFAFLTGLSTSMVRAAIMLSIFSLFAAGGRQRASLNLLALTLIIMLLYDSSQLYDVGFQLSFSAVFAILIITPIFERFVSKKYLMEHPLQRWLWGLLTVSLAAQIGVAPLIAHYFGHFSTYFLLTNLFVLPITTVILYGALAFLLTSWIFIGKALLWLVSVLGQGLTLIAGLPCASIDGLHPSVMQTCMVYLVIVCILIAILTILPPKNTKRKFA